MKLATIRLPASPDGEGRSRAPDEATVAVRIDGDHAVELDAPDVGALLARPGWRQFAATAAGPERAVAGLDYAPVITRPGKIICVGLNYRAHIAETGRAAPEYPALFAKYAEALIGARDPITLPRESAQVDWEAELGVIVGARARHADAAESASAIGGYTVANDVTARDWQNRTPQWLQGKTFEASTPLGPWLVTPDEADPNPPGLLLSCQLDGEIVQQAQTGDLIFGPAELISYISAIITLRPGDVILTGTPGGVGHARVPPRYLSAGSQLITSIAGLGECRNACTSAAALAL